MLGISFNTYWSHSEKLYRSRGGAAAGRGGGEGGEGEVGVVVVVVVVVVVIVVVVGGGAGCYFYPQNSDDDDDDDDDGEGEGEGDVADWHIYTGILTITTRVSVFATGMLTTQTPAERTVLRPSPFVRLSWWPCLT